MAEEEEKETKIEEKREESETKTNKSTEEILKKRKEKFSSFFKGKNYKWIYFVLLLVLVLIVIFVRTSNVPYLIDQTTGEYTLGPDLDPFLFLRYAKIIATEGSLPEIDIMRNVPLGFRTGIETRLLPYTITYLYKILHFFNPEISIEYAAIILPVIFFALSLIVFFFLVRKLFDKNKFKEIIALSSTALIAFIPSMLHRMTAGIPEKECMGIFFFFLAFLFFIYGYNANKNKKTLIYAILAGISTGLLAQVWGGVSFTLIIIGLFGFSLIFLNKINKRIFILFAAWFIFTIVFGVGSQRFQDIPSFFVNILSLFSFLSILFMGIHLWARKRIEKILKIKDKFPPALVTIAIGITLSIILALILFGPNYIINNVNSVFTSLLHPMGVDRLTLTVAENNQPYFDSWVSQFGLNFFWLFFFASIFLFFEAVNILKLKNKFLLTVGYSVMLFFLIFSRHSASSSLNGVSNLSKVAYFGGFILFALVFLGIYVYSFYKKREEFDKFSKIDVNLVFLLVWFLWMAISARGAIRLFLMLCPPAAILVSAIAVKLPQYAMKNKQYLSKVLFWCATAIVIVLIIMSFVSFAQRNVNEARYTIPSYYSVQWQRAMSWVRENTDESAVFSHWWDYGYWIQSIGERATVLDGGNAIGYWNHLFGRHVLTGKTEEEALEFLYAHNVTHLLIDSTEIGKYTAYSSIGSDANYDRYSWIPTFNLDEAQTQETKDETMNVYAGGTMLDQDFVWQDQIFPQGKAGIGALILTNHKESFEIKQPEAVLIYGNKQERVPLRYLYLNNKLYDFGEGESLESCLYVISKIDDSGLNQIGASLYISEKGMEALWVHLYLLNEGENFRLVRNEPDTILTEIQNQYNLTINEIVLYRGNLLGPIKIWEVNYPENIEFKEEYLETVFPDDSLYLSQT
jgi:dolichyl-diphosphooligosaccharide--protein glycosyltransferase